MSKMGNLFQCRKVVVRSCPAIAATVRASIPDCRKRAGCRSSRRLLPRTERETLSPGWNGFHLVSKISRSSRVHGSSESTNLAVDRSRSILGRSARHPDSACDRHMGLPETEGTPSDSADMPRKRVQPVWWG